jgi:lytic murein transglycosylase
MSRAVLTPIILVLAVLWNGAALAVVPPCQTTGSFERWLDDFRKEAAETGISRKTIASALGGMTLDRGIIARDRRQSFFAQSFLSFSDKLATRSRMDAGRRKIAQRRSVFAAVEKQYGVPPGVIAAFWALESDFGVGMGNLPVLRSLAALAYDCRRGDLFRGELMAALKIIDRGDLRPSEMIGSWAGELGQTQFLPNHYFNYAVDFDGDGRRDLLHSDADVIASTAAFLVGLGWQRGEPWLEEVRVPANMPWDQADLAIQHPRSQWSKWHVTKANGAALQNDAQPASLLLLMGRHGPAFLAYPNFQVYLKWNQSLVYATTAAYLATRIEGASPMHRGRERVVSLTGDEVKELQRQLAKAKLYVGEADGKLGAVTRAAVKQAQLKFGFPADSYPDAALLARLRRN